MATAGHTTGSAPSSASSHLAIDSSPPQVGGEVVGEKEKDNMTRMRSKVRRA
jgi:hypothetical protein